MRNAGIGLFALGLGLVTTGLLLSYVPSAPSRAYYDDELKAILALTLCWPIGAFATTTGAVLWPIGHTLRTEQPGGSY